MSRGGMSFRSGDDAARDAVAPMLSELRAELLVLPSEPIVEKHVDMMTFERQVVGTPRVARKPRPAMSRPRRTAFVLACVSATVASCGLSAAGALPEPLQKITESIAHTLGVPEPHDATPATSSGAGAAPTPTTPSIAHPPAAAPTPRVTTPAKRGTPRQARAAGHGTPAHPPTSTTPVEPAAPPAFPARPTDPSKRITPKPTPKPPSNHSDNTPKGYPSDWRDRAIAAATSGLQQCAQAGVLAPTACPQSATASDPTSPAANVQWKLLNDPAQGAAAVAWTTTPAGGGAATTTVTVYERFQMDATYTQAATGARSLLAYSSGIGQATMRWNGKSFEQVTFVTGSVAGHLMHGVHVGAFSRPDVWDFMVLSAVESAFEQCTSTGTPAPTCPPGGLLDTPATAQSTLNGDVMSTATLSFDNQVGTYSVTGPYSMTNAAGAPVTGSYLATLFVDNGVVRVLSVTAH
jgi:hypothetical protein